MSTISPPLIQQPSVLWVPERKGTYGDIVNGWADSLVGLPRDAEQRRDIDCLTSYGPGGSWLTLETLIEEGRQNGKTKAVLLTIALADLFLGLGGPDRIFWTAHLMSTALDTFTTVKKLIDNNPELSKRVREVKDSKTKEGVYLHDGSEMLFVARAGGAGRGFGGKRTVFDEALFLPMTNIGALFPTMSARYNPQISYGASAGVVESDHLRSLERRAMRNNDPSLSAVIYKAPGGWRDPGCARGLKCDHIYENPLNEISVTRNGVTVHGCAMDNESNWKMANHAILAGRMRIQFVRAERRALCQNPEGVLEFGRERMGWTEDGGVAPDPDRIQPGVWTSQTDPSSEPVGDVVFAVDMTPSGSHVSIGMAGKRADGGIHFGVIEHRIGTSWVAERLNDLMEKWDTMCGVLWCPTAPIKALKSELTNASVPLVDVSAQEYAEACGSMKVHLVDRGDAWHRGDRVLNDAYESHVRSVQAEGGWTVGRLKSGPVVSPFVAAILAVKGVDDNAGVEPGVWEL